MRVTDRAGNTLDSAIQDVVVDNTNPTGSLTAPADAAVLGGASVTVSSDSADAGSGVATAEFQRRPAGGGPWTTIDTDTGAPYSVAWDTTPLTDGDYDLRVLTTDEAGNTFASATRTVTVDNNAPSVTVTAPTGFVNAAAPDPFTVTASTPDGDVDDVELFRCSNASAGCSSGSWVSLGVDTTAPYSASWAIDPDGNRALRAVATDGAGNTGADVVNVTVDRTSAIGSLTAPADASFVTGAAVAVSSDSADAGSGVATAEFQRRPAGGGPWTTIDTDTSAPYSVAWDTTSLTDGDFDLRVVTTDEAGNTFASATRTVTVDNSAPSAPALTLSESSPFAHVSGSEIFVNTDETGSYDVDATSADAHSGIDKVRFPGPTDDSSSPYSATYGFGDLAGAQTVTAFNGAGLTASSQFTVTPDTAEPAGGSVSLPGRLRRRRRRHDHRRRRHGRALRRRARLRRPRAAHGPALRRRLRPVRRRLEHGHEPRHGRLRPVRAVPLPRLRPRRQRGRLHVARTSSRSTSSTRPRRSSRWTSRARSRTSSAPRSS